MPASEVMEEFRRGRLHSGRGKGGRKGRIVRSKRQARAILLSELRREGRIPERGKTRRRKKSPRKTHRKRS